MKTTYSMRSALVEDLRVRGVPLPPNPGRLRLWRYLLPAFIFNPGVACIFYYRLNRVVYRRSRILGRLLHAYRFYRFANDISYLAEIGPGCNLSHTVGIVIGKGVVIGKNCTIYHNVTIGAKRFEKLNEKPTVGDNVTIGVGACVLGDIVIGANVQIGALTFCDQSVPDNSVAYGRPLIIKSRA